MPGKLGFIGLGNMGARMAKRLLDAGHDLLVCDVNAEAVGALARSGAVPAATPSEVASRAEVVFCSLPTPSVVQEVLIGPGGVIEGVGAGIVVDLSTTGPTVTRKAAARLGERGTRLLDAPVSGGVVGAEAGTLAIMASGQEDAFRRVQPTLELLGKNLFYLGEEPGLGQSMKLVNNMLVAATAIASFEVLVMGRKAGLDAKAMVDVINASSGRNFIMTDKIPHCVLPGSFPLRFATELLYKDVKLGVEEAEALGVPLWVVHSAREFLALAMSQGDGAVDYAQTIRHFERWAGVEVRG